MFKDKPCKLCGKVFNPVAACNLYCSDECKAVAKEVARVAGWKRYEKKHNPNEGVGSGGVNKKGKEHPQYKTGKGFLEANRHKFRLQVGFCEDCGTDLRYVTGVNRFCIHHRDHNRKNNPEDFSNWELLCPRCHHIHHDKQLHLNVQRPVREDVQELGVLGNGEEPSGS